MKKALSSTDLLAKKYDLIDWDGEWLDNFDSPESRGVWSVSGNSGNGKTSFLLQLAKECTNHGRVLYNSLEEGDSLTMQKAWQMHGLQDCGRKIQLIKSTPEQLDLRLSKRQSPDIIIIDSWQYMNLNFKEYLEMKEKYSKKLFIINQQMDGNKIMGKTGARINYDADLKIWVEGFKAFSKGRYFGKHWEKGFIIWDKGAKIYWGKNKQTNE
ncbi:MAG: hypothetical protein LC112_07630 [Flavobacteriales bacterium]|nr:hypothetical protein [Flavobacteriales bacterium]